MKKILVLTTAVFLFTGMAFANGGNDKDKGKDKNKKANTTKPCPGKECSKKKSAAAKS